MARLCSCVCRTVFLVTVALISIRFYMTPPLHKNPPEVSVSLDSESWNAELQHHLSVHGYAQVNGILTQAEVEHARNIVENFCYGDPRKAVALPYGGYSIPAFLELPEFTEVKWLKDDPRLHEVLRVVFNGTQYRFAGQNDVGCNFVGVWHKGLPSGEVARSQACDAGSSDHHGEQAEIYKFMFYLQDHDDDDPAITFVPGSHVYSDPPWNGGYVSLNPRMGDLLIFDQRILHTGKLLYSLFRPRKFFLQLAFGRDNRFTDEFERGTIKRQQKLQKQMLASPSHGFLSAFVDDAKSALMGVMLSFLPPQLLNVYSDQASLISSTHACTATAAESSADEL